MENSSRKTVFIQFVIPFLCVMTVATVIGTWLAASREVYSFGYVVCRIAILWCSLGSGLFFSSFVITEIMARQIGSRNHNRTFALMAYACSAAYLVIVVVELFPFFGELLVLAFYSCYLYWRGIPGMIGVRDQKQMIFGLLSFVIVALVFMLMFYFFGNILKAIFI